MNGFVSLKHVVGVAAPRPPRQGFRVRGAALANLWWAGDRYTMSREEVTPVYYDRESEAMTGLM